MQILPVPASGWFNTELTSEQRITLLYSGILPVNDVFLPLWQKKPAIWMLRGGRGGGKSEAVCDRLIKACIEEPYFKCYYGRKVFDTVRGSCFETLIACIKKMGIEHEFHYSDANKSSMIITHRRTGNKFVPFGSDKAYKLKSIRNPTHIWCEEFPEFDFEDFKELFPTLRTSGASNQFIGTMNAYSLFPSDWIVKVFYPNEYNGDDKSEIKILEGVEVDYIYANYTDNYFIDQEDYRQRLWVSAAGNLIIFEGLANGALGVVENNAPWLTSFDQQKHVKKVPFLPSFPVYLSFDFNNDPFTCTAWQMSPMFGNRDSSFLHCLREFVGKYKIEEMCDRIKQTFPASIIKITGDRSGKNEDIGRHQTLYKMIASILGVSERNIDTPDSNLEHADSRILCNAMYYNYPNFFIDPSCSIFIKDCQLATIDTKKGASHLLKDRENYKMDVFDTMRYLLQTYFHEFAQKTYLRILNKR